MTEAAIDGTFFRRGLSGLIKVSSIGAVISGVLLAVLTIHVTVDVVTRVMRGYPLGNTLEIVANIWMPAIVFLALSAALVREEHLRVGILIDSLSPRARFAADALACAVIFIVLGYVSYVLGIEAYGSYQIGEAETGSGGQILIWPAKVVASIGTGLMALQGGVLILANLAKIGDAQQQLEDKEISH